MKLYLIQGAEPMSDTQKNQATAILGLLTQTSLHAGLGQSTDVVDLPIQREGHNGWPCVFGSAMKGALRTKAEDEKGKDNQELLTAFGPDTNHGQDYASAIAVTDARLLLLPVRSLTSHFKWVTCPEALQRLNRDLCMLGLKQIGLSELSIKEDEALVPEASSDEQLFLEEYHFDCKKVDLKEIINLLKQLMKRDDAEDVLKNQLVIVKDDIFAYLVKHAVPVNIHISLDSETKTVAEGPWYEETLPPDSLLYTALIARNSRNKDVTKSAEQVLKFVTDLVQNKWLQVGGNETVGMGWCGVKIYTETAQ